MHPVATLSDAAATLSPRQQHILTVIRESVHSRGYPPSVREIGEAVGLTSPSSVAYQLTVLHNKGLLRRDPHRPRAVDVRQDNTREGPTQITTDDGNVVELRPRPRYVPMVGRIAAGGPILAEQN
ncbi:MAG: transcriptional repressor LexA, partial [Mycobacteriales bacterium]